MDRLNHLKSRKDARLFFSEDQNVAVRCLTNTCNFDARIKNVSSSGIYIATNQHLPMGEDIEVSFIFPDSGNRVRASGKVVRVEDCGIGVEIKVHFKQNGNRRLPQPTVRKKQPRLIFLDPSIPSE